MEDFIIKRALSASEHQNIFNKARVLLLKNDESAAIEKFQNLCYEIEEIYKNNPESNVELELIPLSLRELSEIYRKRDDFDKALLHLSCSNLFLGFLAKRNRKNEVNDEEDSNERQKKQSDLDNIPAINDIFVKMHQAFNRPNKPTKEEIIKGIVDVKRREDEEIAKQNMEFFMRAKQEKLEQLKNSRFKRFLEYIDKHPIEIAIGFMLFMFVFLFIAFCIFDSGTVVFKTGERFKDIYNSMEQTNKMGHEQARILKDNFRKMRGDSKKKNRKRNKDMEL